MNFSRPMRSFYYRAILCPAFTMIYDRFARHRAGTRTLGDRGEVQAERYLLRRGYVIVARGFEARGGEVDLVAVDGQRVVFIEVKTRSSDRKGHPAESVDRKKQTHLTKTAYAFLKKHGLTDCAFRFDIIAIVWPDLTQPPQIQHLENAFEAVGDYQLV